jgi:hypothetical protein
MRVSMKVIVDIKYGMRKKKDEIEKKNKFKMNLNKNIKIMITKSNRQEKIKGE